MDEATKRREVETRVIDKVGEVIAAIRVAKHVDQVICALHSFAVRLFPIDSSLISGTIDRRNKEQVSDIEVPSADERRVWWQAFYQGVAFPTLARILLLDVASDWLACFPYSVQKHIYDAFFLEGLATEVVQVLVPYLQKSERDGVNNGVVSKNTERLVVRCLLENGGVLQMAREVSNLINGSQKSFVSRLAQIVTSIPDRARLRASPLLSSHLFFKEIISQLISGLEEKASNSEGSSLDGVILFVGETFSRICRRGSSDLLLSEVTPCVLEHVRRVLSLNIGSDEISVFEMDPVSQRWAKIMEAVTDSYAVERIAERLLHQMVTENASDIEAYWTLCLLFHQIVEQHTSVRSIFVDKFLSWKVFPICCLRWILQFSVLKCPPVNYSLAKGVDTHGLLDTVQRLASIWSKREFVQAATLEQQAYITAAVGLCLEIMSKEELNKTTDVMHNILHGVSCRLESPAQLIRKTASCIALVISKVITPENPLYLDDSYAEGGIDWEFGLKTSGSSTEKGFDETKISINAAPVNEIDSKIKDISRDKKKGKGKKLSEFKMVDPDEIIDLATLNYGSDSDKDDDENATDDSDSLSDSSLQPYDLSDDDTDLTGKLTQLVDVVGALRKTDDADGVEKALDVAEKLVRASPDELTHIAGDFVRTLIQVRCCDVALEGEEDSAEEKRQKALIALTVTCPFESLDTMNKLLFSPNLDTSQRIMILDVMTEAAEELRSAKTMKPRRQTNPLISTISDTQPWFLPSDVGPPGAGSWKEISETETPLNWSNRYERELPQKTSKIRSGKTRRWGLKSVNKQENQTEWSHNKFPIYAAAFMLPAMQGFDKKSHGVDFLGRDFIVLGKLIYTLGVCMRCASMHPEASALATPFLDMLQRREICHHKEAYVRKAVLYAASCLLLALHPSYVASALVEGNLELSNGLEWIRTWALHVADSDTDRECYTMAMSCLQLHAEMALQASRSLESEETAFKLKTNNVGLLSSSLSKMTIKIP